MHYFPREQLYPNEIIGLTFKIALCKAHSLSVTHIKKIKIASNVPIIVIPNFTWDNLRCTDIGPEKVTILNWTELQAFLTDFWTIFDRCLRRSTTVGNIANLRNNSEKWLEYIKRVTILTFCRQGCGNPAKACKVPKKSRFSQLLKRVKKRIKMEALGKSCKDIYKPESYLHYSEPP